MLSPEAFARAKEALLAFRRLAERHGCDAMLAVATSAVREAQNGGEFVRAIRDETGVDLRDISGDEEARPGKAAFVGRRCGEVDLHVSRMGISDLRTGCFGDGLAPHRR